MSVTSSKVNKLIETIQTYIGKLYGKGTIQFKNGDKYEGHFKASLRDGIGVMDYLNDYRKDDEEKNGRYKGEWK